MISDLAAKKENIYIIYPFPELNRSINHLVAIDYISDSDLSNINGTSRDWYELRNSSVIQHFESRDNPKNVHFINPVDIFCDDDFCFAVRDKTPLYFDSNHPSVVATDKVVELIQVK
jgi:hypothetical protein